VAWKLIGDRAGRKGGTHHHIARRAKTQSLNPNNSNNPNVRGY
jgi:hypothetical protein